MATMTSYVDFCIARFFGRKQLMQLQEKGTSKFCSHCCCWLEQWTFALHLTHPDFHWKTKNITSTSVSSCSTTQAAKTLIQAFVSCHLDYCNSLYGVCDGLMRKLQSTQNAATRLITGIRRCDHITHVLRQLHCLPVQRQVDYKIACLVQQSLSGLAPAYLADDVNLVADSGRRLLRSAADRTLCRPTYTQHLWWQEFHCCRSTSVKQSTVSVVTGHQLRTIQTTTENISVQDELTTAHTDCLFAGLRNTRTYIHTYLLTYLWYRYTWTQHTL